MSTRPRINIPGIAVRPQGFTRHVAWLAGGDYRRSQRNVPMACLGNRTACYFGKHNCWALFENYARMDKTYNPITAALWLQEVP